MGYTEGCGFKVGITICKKTLPKYEISRMLATGKTEKLHGFISKGGKPFSAKLMIKDGAAVFDFT